MKKLLIAVVAMALSGAAMAMTLQAAKAQIPGAVANPAKMAEIMKELSEDDQIEFLALVNAAIAEMNASPAEAAAMYLAVNEAALKAHGEGNLRALLATTFATVPPEALTVLNEQLAKDLFNRNADPTRPVSDGDFAALAKEAMEAIATRASDTDDAAVRTTFAVLMFVRASEGTPADLREALAETISDPTVRETALTEWIPAALGENTSQTYDPMLGGSVDVETTVPTSDNVQQVVAAKEETSQTQPAQESSENVLTIATPQDIVPLLSDLGALGTDYIDATVLNMPNIGTPEYAQQSVGAPVSVSEIDDAPWNPQNPGSGGSEGYVEPTPGPGPEPDPYLFQSFSL